jgi:hypothetical protein
MRRQQQNQQQSSSLNSHLTLRTTTLLRQNKNRAGLSPNSWINGTSAPVWDKPTESALTSKVPYNGFYSDEEDEESDGDFGRAGSSNPRELSRHRSISSFELRNKCPAARPALRNEVRRQRTKKQVRYKDDPTPMLYVPPSDDTDSDQPAVYIRARNK